MRICKEIINKSEVAGNVVKQMEDRYGSLTPQQIKQITFEVNRMPKKMNLSGVESLKRMYDDLIPDSFWAKLDDPAQAFPSLVKYTLRDNARQIINEKAPNVAVRELNNRMSIAMDVKKLAAMQLAKRMQFKGAQTGGGFFITRYIAKAIDDYVLNPMLTTQVAQGVKRIGQKTGQTALRQAGRILTTKFGEKAITESSKQDKQ
jgi:hypothetical protein